MLMVILLMHVDGYSINVIGEYSIVDIGGY
jgi:hypothetical protein